MTFSRNLSSRSTVRQAHSLRWLRHLLPLCGALLCSLRQAKALTARLVTAVLYTNQCAPVRGVLDRIIELMATPLIQGTLRYAYKVGISTNAKEAAEVS